MNESYLVDQFDEKQIEDIAFEYGLVFDWFRQNYPEGDIRLDVNADRTQGHIKYKLSVMTGKEMTDNQGFFTSEITVSGHNFRNLFWMDSFKKSIYPRYTAAITKAINEHYANNRKIN